MLLELKTDTWVSPFLQTSIKRFPLNPFTLSSVLEGYHYWRLLWDSTVILKIKRLSRYLNMRWNNLFLFKYLLKCQRIPELRGLQRLLGWSGNALVLWGWALLWCFHLYYVKVKCSQDLSQSYVAQRDGGGLRWKRLSFSLNCVWLHAYLRVPRQTTNARGHSEIHK